MEFNQITSRGIPRRKFLEMSMKGGLLIAATPTLLTHLVSCQSVSAAGAGPR